MAEPELQLPAGWRRVHGGDLPFLKERVQASFYQAPAFAESLGYVASGQLPLEALGWLAWDDDTGRVQAVSTSRFCLEALLAEGLSPQLLLPLWAGLATDLRKLQAPLAWWEALGPDLEAAVGAKARLMPLVPCQAPCGVVASGPMPDGFGWATEEEVPQVALLDRQHDLELYWGQEYIGLEKRVGQICWLVDQQRLLVRRVGGAIVFQAQFASADPTGAEVHGFVTHPEHRGQGHAAAGLVALAHLALDRGWASLRTALPAEKPGLLAMYEAAGFRFASQRLCQAFWDEP